MPAPATKPPANKSDGLANALGSLRKGMAAAAARGPSGNAGAKRIGSDLSMEALPSDVRTAGSTNPSSAQQFGAKLQASTDWSH